MTKNITGNQGKDQRSIRNLVLQPILQIKFAIFYIVLSAVFSALLVSVLYLNLEKFVDVVLELTGVREEVAELLFQYIEPAKVQLLLLMVIYIIVSTILSVKLTHSLVGPTVAFRRHIQKIKDGDFNYRTKLRDGDAFFEVAEDLNSLSAKLASNINSQS